MKNGEGCCYFALDGSKLNGIWTCNLFEKGQLILKNGVNFDGDWRDDKFSGVGIINFPNGDCYQGEWKER